MRRVFRPATLGDPSASSGHRAARTLTSVSGILPTLVLLKRCQAIMPQNISQWHKPTVNRLISQYTKVLHCPCKAKLELDVI